MKRIALVFVMVLFATSAATAREPQRLAGKIENKIYTHPSGAFRVKVTSQHIEDGEPGVYFTYIAEPFGAMSGADMVALVPARVSAGKTMPEMLAAWVDDINRAKYRFNSTKASVVSSQEETVLNRKSYYAKIALPQFPGTGVTIFGERGRQINADFVEHLHFVYIGDLGLTRNAKPLEWIAVESLQTDALKPLGGDSLAAHMDFLNGIEITKP